MGKTGFEAAKEEEIRRSKAFETQKNGSMSEMEINTDTKKDMPLKEDMKDAGHTDKAKKEAGRSGSVKSNEKLEELKKNAGTMPYHIPEKKAETAVPQPVQILSQKTENEVRGEMKSYHTTLEAEEKRVFGKEGIRNIKRNRYASLSESKKNKRVNSAIRRQANAAAITAAEERMKGKEWVHFEIDKERFEKEVRGFMMLTDEPFIMDKDEAFARNLERNYELCETAWRMKKWVSDAVDGGYFPKSMDLSAVEAKIARFAELKEYLDVQKELMKNPYYQYMAKGDISYNDEQIKKLKNGTGDVTLKDYLTKVQTLRGLSFVRKQGMDSVKTKAAKEGKRQAEILRTRAAKRQLIRTFSDEAMYITGNQRFRDRNYDTRFTQEAFEEALDNFRKLNVKDLHFKNIKDIADHFKENARMFDEAREFDHMLFVAVQRNLAPSDDEMIMLRSKIKAFKGAEYMMNSIQKDILQRPDRFLNEKTEKEFLMDHRSNIKTKTDPDAAYDMPMPGQDMDSYYKSVLKAVREEHNDRAKAIRMSYGLMHPVKEEDEEEGNVTYSLGEIPQEELTRRSRDYEKNAFINDYIADLEHYTAFGYGARAQSFVEVYGKRRKKQILSTKNRVVSRYIIGMSSEELKSFVDVQEFGTDKEREALWLKIFNEGKAQNLTEFDSDDPKVLMDNMAYKSRVSGMLGNFAGNGSPLPDHIKDQAILTEADVIYDAGCGHALKYGSLSQNMKYRWLRSVPLKEWLGADADLLNEFQMYLDELSTDHPKSQIILDRKTITKDMSDSRTLKNFLYQPYFDREAKLPKDNKARRKAKDVNTASISIYESRKKYGLIKETTKEELKGIRDFYRANPVKEEEKEVVLKNLKSDDKAQELEKKFKAIMSFDLSLFSYKSYKDIADPGKKNKERFSNCTKIARLAEKIPEYIEQYSSLKSARVLSGKLKYRLNDEHLKEIASRAAVIKQGGAFFGESFRRILESPALDSTDMSLDDILHLTEKEIGQKKKAAPEGDAGAAGLWDDVLNVIRQLNGFDLDLKLKAFLPARRFENGCLIEPTADEIINILNDKPRLLKDVKAGNITFVHQPNEAFLRQFAQASKQKSYSVTEREEKMKQDESRLCKKKIIAETLKRNREEAIDQRIAARRRISLKVRMAVGEENLIQLSAFMTGDQKADEKLLSEYADKKTRYSLIDRLVSELIQSQFDYNVDNDTNFAGHAGNLEKLSAKARALDVLLRENPDYEERLKIRSGPDDESDLTAVRKKLDRCLAISDYYRARALLITDPYYINHYNDELSINHDEKSSEEERHIADLISLTAQCAGRFDMVMPYSRSDLGMEAVLGTLEQRSRRRSYLIGRPDLKKADISYTKDADREIRKYFEKVLEDMHGNFDTDGFEVAGIIARSKEEHPFPNAVNLETDAVKRHIAMIRRHGRIFNSDADNEVLKSVLDEKQLKLYQALVPIMRGQFRLEDPKTKEVLYLNTVPARAVNALALCYGEDLPIEEILEMADGFSVIEREKLDVKDPEAFAYAKKRWLESARKLFYLEYNAVKRFESTYGILPDQLPLGSFLHSLGDSKHLIESRLFFIQDMGEFNCVKKCEVGDKRITLGEYLAQNGLINEDELADSIHLNDGFYNRFSFGFTNYQAYSVSSFERGGRDGFSTSYDFMVKINETRSKYDPGGPKLSAGEERKAWKDALSQGTHSMYGEEGFTEYKKRRLDLYSDSERRDLKQRRKEESGLIHFYEETVNERAEVLINHIKEKMGKGSDEDLIKRLIVFHPAMMTGDKLKEIPEKDTSDFISLVKDFTGTDVPEEEKAARRSAAYQIMAERMRSVRGTGFHVNSPVAVGGEKTLIDEETYQYRHERVIYESRLMRTTVMERISETLQSLMRAEEDKSLITPNTYKIFRECQTELLSNSILKALMTSRQYLQLKDVANKEDSVPAYELAEVESMLADMNTDSVVDLDGETLTDYRRGLLKKLYGIEILKTSEILEKDDPLAKKAKSVANDAMEAALAELWMEEGDIVEPEDNAVKEKIDQEEQYKFPPLPQYNVSKKIAGDYEQQGENNCWACTGAALFNKFVETQDGQVTNAITQYDVRAFRPDENTEMQTLEQIRAAGVQMDEKLYNTEKARMLNYMGAGNTAQGNIFEVADFFMKKRSDFAMNRMLINLPALKAGDNQPPKTEEDKAKDAEKHYNQKVAFVEKLKEVLDTGNLVGFYFHSERHYVTITGINGNVVTYMDSAGNEEKTKTVDQMLKREDKGVPVELTWFSKLPDHKRMLDEYPLLYNEETGEYSPSDKSVEEALNIAHTRGVMAGKNELAIGPNMEGISIATYFPKRRKQAVQPALQQQENHDNINIINEEKHQEKLDNINIINEEKHQEKESLNKDGEQKKQDLRPKNYQPEDTTAANVIDLVGAKGGLKMLDELFSGGGDSLGSDFCGEYAGFINRVIERDDFTFDDAGIKKLRDSISDMTNEDSKNKKEKIQKLIKDRQNRFDNRLAPIFREVFSLVSSGVIGKDTARVFLNPYAMTCSIIGKKFFEVKLYNKFISRTEDKKTDPEYEAKYKDSLVSLVKDIAKDSGGIALQKVKNNSRITADNADRLRDLDKFLYFKSKAASDPNFYTGDCDVRCYITVKEEEQEAMITKLRNFLGKDENKKFRGALNFKMKTGLKERRLENIVIYSTSDKNSKFYDVDILKEFIDAFHEEIKDIVSEKDAIPTIMNIKTGIGISAEPVELYEKLFKQIIGYNPLLTNGYGVNQYTKNGYDVVPGVDNKIISDNTKFNGASFTSVTMSWNQYQSRLLILSAYIARHRLNRTDKDRPVSEDKEVLREMKQVYQEFMILSGIDPATMMLKKDQEAVNILTGGRQHQG